MPAPSPPRASAPPLDITVIRGRVAGFRERTEDQGFKDFKHTIRIWNFRLERWDEKTRAPLKPIPVEFRGKNICGGSIEEGDEVVIPGDWQEGQPMRVELIGVVRTGQIISVGSISMAEMKAVPLVTPSFLFSLMLAGASASFGVMSLAAEAPPVALGLFALSVVVLGFGVRSKRKARRTLHARIASRQAAIDDLRKAM